jgi:hypothetical protein
MFTLIRNAGLRKTLSAEATPLASALLIAEFFFKFHSFTLECVAFLATWFAVSYLFSLIKGFRPDKSKTRV